MGNIYQIGIFAIALFMFFALYQKLATIIDDYKYPPLGGLFDIGGYKLHLNTTGQGNITVICDAGD